MNGYRTQHTATFAYSAAETTTTTTTTTATRHNHALVRELRRPQSMLCAVLVPLLLVRHWTTTTTVSSFPLFVPRTTAFAVRTKTTIAKQPPLILSLSNIRARRYPIRTQRQPLVLHVQPPQQEKTRDERSTDNKKSLYKKYASQWKRQWKRWSIQVSKLVRLGRIDRPQQTQSSVTNSSDLVTSTFLSRVPDVVLQQQNISKQENATTLLVPQPPQRWATAAPTTDLSGTWKPILSSDFLAAYDDYLRKCGEGAWFRKMLLSVLSLAQEVIVQRKSGRELSITGTTPVGKWERVLIASGTEHPVVSNKTDTHGRTNNNTNNSDDYNVIYTEFRDPDGDTVQVEAWWEQNGTVHKSRLRQKPRLMGGEIESTRFLVEPPLLLDQNSTSQKQASSVLVCESTFYPPPYQPKFQYAQIVWRFERQ